MGRVADLTGQSFGRLTALRPTGGRRHRSAVWVCRCACGRTHEAAARNLVGRCTRSCGCLRRETTPLNAGYAPSAAGRDASMRRERAAGATLAALAAKYGVSRQRVHQVVKAARTGESASVPYGRRTA
jgi:hypothetical protein